MVLTVIDCHPIIFFEHILCFKRQKRRNTLDKIEEYPFFLFLKIQFLYEKIRPLKKKMVTVG